MEKKAKRTIVLSLIFIIMLVSLAFADGYFVGDDYDLTEYASMIKTIVKVAKIVASCLATVSIASGAFKMLFSGDEGIRKGKQQIIYSLLALALIFLLPVIVKFGIDLGSANGWKPPVPVSK